MAERGDRDVADVGVPFHRWLCPVRSLLEISGNVESRTPPASVAATICSRAVPSTGRGIVGDRNDRRTEANLVDGEGPNAPLDDDAADALDDETAATAIAPFSVAVRQDSHRVIIEGRSRRRTRLSRTHEFLVCIEGRRSSRQEYRRSFSMAEAESRRVAPRRHPVGSVVRKPLRPKWADRHSPTTAGARVEIEASLSPPRASKRW